MAYADGGVESARKGERLIRLSRQQLAQFHDGDPELFRQLVDGLTPRLLAFVRPFATDQDEAHDLVQDTWLRAYQKRDTFTGAGTVLGWLYAVSRNVCLGARRRAEARPVTERSREPDMAASSPDDLAMLERGELRQAVHEAIMRLPERERDVVILRLLEGWSTKEAAQHLGCAEGTVKASLHHAVKKLQVSMEAWVK